MGLSSKFEMLGIGSDEVKDARDLTMGHKISDPTLFICEGLWGARKLLESGVEIESVFADGEYFESAPLDELKIVNEIAMRARHAYIVSKKACAKISDRDGADNVFITAHMPKYSLSDLELPEDLITIIMDGQEQPGNVGAIIRSLDGAGGKFAILTNRQVRPTHTRLIRASLGAAFTMPVITEDIDTLIPWLIDNKFRVVLTDLTATKTYPEISARGRIAIVAGNEHTGISPIWRTLPNAEPIIIPMLGSVESLNVGFASTLVAYHLGLKQKGML